MNDNSNQQEEAPVEAGKIVEINEDQIRGHLDRMMVKGVEDTLNALLDA